MAQIKAHQDHQGIKKGQLYKIYDQDDVDYYLLDHFNFGRVVQYPKKLQETSYDNYSKRDTRKS